MEEKKTNYKLEQWLEIVQDSGVGEILITSIDFDGTKKGFDINLFENIENKINVPYVISGGMGTLEHLKKLKKSVDQAVLQLVHQFITKF